LNDEEEAMSIPCAKETFAGSLLVGLCILAYLPGFLALPPVDRDEPRFAQTSRQMLEAESWGAYLAPRIQDRPRVNKPLLTYWLQAGTAGIFAALHPDAAWADSTTTSAAAAIWPYRVPSLLAAVVAVLATAQLGRSMFGSAGYVAAALVATTPLVAWEARQARADELLLAFTLLAQLALWSIWSERRVATHSLRTAVLLWVAIGLGVMTKGPVTPAVVTATVVCQSLAFQEWRWLGRLHVGLGLCIVALLVAPWTLLLAEQVGWMVYLHSLYDEIVGRSLLPKEGHWGPPGYHLALLAVLFWPGWLFLRPAFAALATWVRIDACL
jgi:4-amino-4-deoxy-L-arabinose transferase-like glycosyltransferase